ncbi:uncharacterized protein LOC125261575 isoform X2 [Megalobrama amblycephala]|nr:uncharacterized protein LOC125261575 isoform X2 [Megalobrama amblycephala]XP_048036085.1 uncharacterized protein LOC125261575 isoform X2 [Megalobrama amblycephala]XP_048036086.1 uncharacterized protein LOC125261575 isoform X2 [Megalobrama amblycephala]
MLDELGVESIEDLTLVEERDLVKYLKPIQSRKLMKGIKDGLVTLNMELVSAPDPSAPSSPTPCSPNTIFQPPNQLLPSPPSTAPSMSSASQPGVPWHVDFRLNWDQVSSAIRLRVEKEERPLPDERKAFVVVLVDQMMQHDRNPTRAMCHSVVRNIIRSHPKSFGDIGKHGDTAGDGCHSLLQQVKTRVEYKNRNNTLAQRRRERRPRTGMAGEARLARGPVDQYGCVRWGPADLPEGETEAMLENIKRDLLNIYSEEGMSGAERAEPMMEKTYVILRKYLNKEPAAAMSEIKQEWPFLFSQKCLFSHFGLLTDVDVLQKLQEAISRRGQTILDYCATLDNPKIRDVLACYDPDSDKAACILLLLMLYFKEPKESLMLEVDPCATAVDVNTAELPGTPCLIIQGDMMKPSGWLVSIEGHVVMGPHPFFLHGVAAFFSSYYVFNLEYPAAGSSTLEFIQRCFLGINPERGSKTKKRTTMNPHVSTLLRKLIDFEWAS